MSPVDIVPGSGRAGAINLRTSPAGWKSRGRQMRQTQGRCSPRAAALFMN